MQGAGMVRSLRQAASLDDAIVTQVNALAGQTRSQMLASLDEMIDSWAETSTMPTSIEAATDKGYTLHYLAPGMNADDITHVFNLLGGSGGGEMASAADLARWNAQRAQIAEIEHRIGVLERFNGVPFVDVGDDGVTTGGGRQLTTQTILNGETGMESRQLFVPLSTTQVDLLQQSYQQLKESVYAGIALETRLQPYLADIGLEIDASGFRFTFDDLEAQLDARHASDPDNALIDRIELLRLGGSALTASGWETQAKLDDWISDAVGSGRWNALRTEMGETYTGAASAQSDTHLMAAAGGTYDGLGGDDLLIGAVGGDTLSGGEGDDTLFGGYGSDVLSGNAGDDGLFGGTGNDSLYAGSGNDVLDGGTGNDTLDGGSGNDTYVWGTGSGHDTVNQYDEATTRSDVLQLVGLNAADIALSKGLADDHLTLTHKASGETLKLSYFYSAANRRLDRLDFADGSSWNTAAILAQEVALNGTTASESLNGRNGGPNVLYGNDGNDTLNGGDGADRLFGGAGNDALTGNAGADVLDGGTGNDTLDGGTGNDTYVWGTGSGHDTLSQYDEATTRSDVLQLVGLNAVDIALSKGLADDHLTLTHKASGETLKLSYFYSAANRRLDRLDFADGSSWNTAAILAQEVAVNGTAANETLNGRNGGPNVLYGHDGTDTLNGGDGADRLFGGTGNDSLYGSSGNDLLDGGTGNDTLEGGNGADTLIGGAANDRLLGGSGNDSYRFARGDGADVVNDYDSTAGNSDQLQFASGIDANQLWLTRNGNHLDVSVIGTTDKVTIENWYSGSAYHVEQLRSGDGQRLLDTQVEALVQAMAAFAPPAAGQTTLPPAYADVLTPVLAAHWQPA